MTLTTSELLASRALGRPVDREWIDWAVLMLENGHDTNSLRILAGELPPYNFRQFELLELVDKTLDELGLLWSDKEFVIKEYVRELLQVMLEGKRSSDEALQILQGLYIELDFANYLSDFYYLFWAQKDLKETTHQYYWPEANQGNIEMIIQEVAQNWINEPY